MSDEDQNPLDAELVSLLAHEKAHVRAPADAKARVLDRVETTLFGPGGGGGNGHGDSPARSPGLGQLARPMSLLAALAIGGLGGAAIMHALEPSPRVVYVDRPAPAISPPAPVVSVSPPASASVPSLAEALALPSAVTGSARATAVAPVSPPSNGQLAQERALLDVARTALGRGEGQATLTALAKHAQRFPNGQLAEEREALGIQALLLLQRNDEARALGARFRQRYPGSVLLPAIEAALAAP